MRHLAALSVLLLTAFSTPIFCDDIVYRAPSGELCVIDIDTESPFSEVISRIHSNIEEQAFVNRIDLENTLAKNEFLLDFRGRRSQAAEKKEIYSKGPLRNFSAPLSEQEKKTIGRIIETLGNASLMTIAKDKSSLEKAGKAVEHVHPLKFLAHIFSNEKLKAAMHNLNGRSWVWDKFFKGFKNRLDEEAGSDNVNPHIKTFSASLKIDPKASKTLYSHAEQKRWKDFINVLFKEFPRSESSGRYDM